MNAEDAVAHSLRAIRRADSEAEQAQLAFALGDFDNYFARNGHG
jgi:hypothetical protein